jgi:hypothetical protein
VTNRLELNVELSRRLEFAEAQVAVEGANTMMASDPETSVALERVAGGYAVYCGANSPITQAVGLGLNGPVSAGNSIGWKNSTFRETSRCGLRPLPWLMLRCLRFTASGDTA